MDIKSFQLPQIRTPLWARGGHLQTLWAHYLPSVKIQESARIFKVWTAEGDALVCEDFYREGDTIFVLLHGLSGDSSADYMQITGEALLAQQCHVVLMNHRGAGPYWKQAKNFYHSGRAEDLSSVLAHLREYYPGKKLVTIGFSMSGNIVALNATGFRSEAVADCAISFNAPVDLAACSLALGAGFNRVYDLRFVSRLKETIETKAAFEGQTLPFTISRFGTVRDVDALFTAPYSGFRDREDYYATCSSRQYLKDTQVPLWLIATQDDPFVPIATYQGIEQNELVQLSVLPTGGHLGYLHQGARGAERWLSLWAKDFANQWKART